MVDQTLPKWFLSQVQVHHKNVNFTFSVYNCAFGKQGYLDLSLFVLIVKKDSAG